MRELLSVLLLNLPSPKALPPVLGIETQCCQGEWQSRSDRVRVWGRSADLELEEPKAAMQCSFGAALRAI